MVVRTPADNAYKKDFNRRSASLDAKVTLPDDSEVRVEASHSDLTGRTIAFNAFFDARILSNSAKADYNSDLPIGRLTATAYYTDAIMPWVSAEPAGPQRLSDRVMVGQVSDLFKIGPKDSFRLASRPGMTR